VCNSHVLCYLSSVLCPPPSVLSPQPSIVKPLYGMQVKDLFETLLSLQPRVSSGGGLSREDLVDQAAESLLNR
jgi:hypothetical protein